MSGFRAIYTSEEDMSVLNLIINTESYYMIKGRAFWEDVSNTGYIDRSWQSLRERFEKHILPRINDYEISEEHKKMIQLAYYQLGNDCKFSSSESGISFDESDENEEDDKSNENKDDDKLNVNKEDDKSNENKEDTGSNENKENDKSNENQGDDEEVGSDIVVA